MSASEATRRKVVEKKVKTSRDLDISLDNLEVFKQTHVQSNDFP